MTRKERNARWRAANAAKHLASNRASRRKHIVRKRQRDTEWRKANPEKERARMLNWVANNPAKARAKYARRRARRLNQICKCCTSLEISAVYIRCPKDHEVDHRIPLALGGLHCAANLQILTKKQHAKKTAEDIRDITAFRLAMREIDAASKRK
jgi:5-methylcytosine-specific restriction endonuclease McrA